MLLVARRPRSEAIPTRLIDVYALLLVTAVSLGVVLTFDELPLTWIVLLPAIWAGLTLGPWTSAEAQPLRGDSALTNTYHAQLLPWADRDGGLIVTYSRNARNMTRDAWPRPERYRIAVTAATRPDGAPD
jgi:hypothetical protein